MSGTSADWRSTATCERFSRELMPGGKEITRILKVLMKLFMISWNQTRVCFCVILWIYVMNIPQQTSIKSSPISFSSLSTFVMQFHSNHHEVSWKSSNKLRLNSPSSSRSANALLHSLTVVIQWSFRKHDYINAFLTRFFNQSQIFHKICVDNFLRIWKTFGWRIEFHDGSGVKRWRGWRWWQGFVLNIEGIFGFSAKRLKVIRKYFENQIQKSLRSSTFCE